MRYQTREEYNVSKKTDKGEGEKGEEGEAGGGRRGRRQKGEEGEGRGGRRGRREKGEQAHYTSTGTDGGSPSIFPSGRHTQRPAKSCSPRPQRQRCVASLSPLVGPVCRCHRPAPLEGGREGGREGGGREGREGERDGVREQREG